MTARDVRQAVVERWRLLVVGLLVGAVVGALVALVAPARYESGTTVFFSSPLGSGDAAQTYQADVLARERATYYVPLVVEDRVTRTVAERVGGDLTSRQVGSAIDAVVPVDTPLLQLLVTDPSPERAQQIAAATADALVGLVALIETPPVQEGAGAPTPQVVATVVQPATFSTDAVTPGLAVLIVLGAVVGLVAGGVLAAVRHFRDPVVRTPDDVRDVVACPVLAEMARSPGPAETSAAHVEAARKLRSALDHLGPGAAPRIVAVAGVRGGEGASTVTALLARAVARAGRTVAVVEADLRHPRVAALLGVTGEGAGLEHALRGRAAAADLLVRRDGIAVLPAGGTPEDAAELLTAPALGALLGRLASTHHTVLVDVPAVLPYADAATVATHTAGVVLVARSGGTPGDDLVDAAGTLAVVGADTIGAVLVARGPERSSRPGGGRDVGAGSAERGPRPPEAEPTGPSATAGHEPPDATSEPSRPATPTSASRA